MANEVATAWVSVVPTAKGFESKLSREVGSAGDTTGKKVGSSFGKAFGAGAALAAGAGALTFFKGAIEGASDLEEATSKTKVVFGDAADEILKFSEGGAKAFGQTKNEVLAAASTFGTFGKAAGLSGKELSTFSSDFVSLSADLASFHNATPQEAVDALGAALRGEAEPMRRFGVLLDDASLKAEAMKQGLISTTKDALTPQQKTLAAQALIMKQTKDAQGDFARTSDGLANSQRILSASFGDLQTKVGTAFLPVVTMAVQGAIGLVDAISGAGPALSTVGGFFQSAFASALPTLTSLGNTIRANLLPVVQQAATTFQTTILPALIRLGTYIVSNVVPIVQRLAQIFVSQVLPIVGNLASFIVGTLVPALVQVYTKVASNLKPVFEQLVATFRTRVLPAISELLRKFAEWQPTIQRVIAVVVKIIGKVLEFASAILGKVLPVVIRFAGFLLGNLVSAVSTVIGWIVKIVGKMIDFGGAMIDGARKVNDFANKVDAGIRRVLGWFADLPGKIKAAFSGAGSWLVQAGKDVVQGLINGLDTAKDWVIGKVREIADLIPGWLKKRLGIHSPSRVTRKLGLHVSEGLAKGIEDGKKLIVDALEKVIGEAGQRLDGLKNSMKSVADSISQAFKVDLLGGSLADFFTSGNEAVGKAETMQKALDSLQAKGAAPEFLSDLFASGNAALIAELDAANSETLFSAQNLYKQQEDLLARLGEDAGLAQFGRDIAAMTAEISTMNSTLATLAADTGREVGNAVNSAAANASRGKGKGKGGKGKK